MKAGKGTPKPILFYLLSKYCPLKIFLYLLIPNHKQPMTRILSVVALTLFTLSFGQQAPTTVKTNFTKEVLAQKVLTSEGSKQTLQQIFNQNKGKVVVMDFWAGWCADCLKAMPDLEKLEKNNPEIKFLYFSLDRTKEAFEKNLAKFDMGNKQNYWFMDGWRNDFNDYIDLNWIPRYLVIDQASNIAKYYAISPSDPDLQKTIDDLIRPVTKGIGQAEK